MATWTFEKRPGAPAGTIGIDLQGVGTPGAPDFAIDDTPGATIVTSDPVAAFALLRESYLRLQGVDSGPSPSTPVERRVVTVDGVLHELAPDGTATTIPVAKVADLGDDPEIPSEGLVMVIGTDGGLDAITYNGEEL